MNIFEFSNYKAFLKKYMANLPKKGRGEVNKIGEMIGVHPTLVSQVLNGNKDFVQEHAFKLCDYLGLNPLETEYFMLLVQVERAGTAELKKHYKIKIEKLKQSSLNVANRIREHRSLTDTESAIFYSSWLYSAIRLFTSIGKGQTLDSVSQRFEIPRKLASEILNFLKETNLCNEHDGLFTMGAQRTHVDSQSPFISRQHANWRLKGLQHSIHLQEDELMYTSPCSLSRKDFETLREQIMSFIKQSSAIIRDSPAEDLACINIDLFWIKK